MLNFLLQPLANAMFSSLGLFKEVECPDVLQCSMPSCMFAHHGRRNPKKRSISASQLSWTSTEPKNPGDEEECIDQMPQPRKRIRITDHDEENSMRTLDPIIKSPKEFSAKSESNGGIFYGISQKGNQSQTLPSQSRKRFQTSSEKLPATKPDETIKTTLTATKVCKHAKSTQKPIKETLNPRILPNPPASHATRYKLISLLHEYMTKLNEDIKKSTDPSISALVMDPQDIITEILDMEERVAKDQPTIYTNILKREISNVKNMDGVKWKDDREKKNGLTQPLKDSPTERLKSTPKYIDLLIHEQIGLLKYLTNNRPDLLRHKYVMSAPTDEEIEQARQGVEAAQGWEKCDRCNTRFQVFPGRREDGALTTGAPCHYHPSRMKIKNVFHGCCNEAIGATSGCTTADTHVFKVSETKRLASILPFVETPTNPTPENNIALNIDCEMGFTSVGFELIRVTATIWPSGDDFIDVLVKPQGEFLDMNTAYSGIRLEDFQNAIPYSEPNSTEPTTTDPTATGPAATDPTAADPNSSIKRSDLFKVVGSPAEARSLLFRHINPSTPLIGHALENDLNVLRIIHPTIIDTAILYPHPRGLPCRSGLKWLTKDYLKRDIQMGGDSGHDSKEDANAAGELVLIRVKEQWIGMQKQGWTLREGQFVNPAGPGGKSQADESKSQADVGSKSNAEPEVKPKSLPETIEAEPTKPIIPPQRTHTEGKNFSPP